MPRLSTESPRFPNINPNQLAKYADTCRAKPSYSPNIGYSRTLDLLSSPERRLSKRKMLHLTAHGLSHRILPRKLLCH